MLPKVKYIPFSHCMVVRISRPIVKSATICAGTWLSWITRMFLSLQASVSICSVSSDIVATTLRAGPENLRVQSVLDISKSKFISNY